MSGIACFCTIIELMSLPSFASEVEQQKATKIISGLTRKTADNQLKILISPCTPPGSIGDEAMIQSITTHFTRLGHEVDVSTISHGETWKDSIEGMHDDILIERRPDTLEHVVNILNKYDYFYVIGADVLDGYYDQGEYSTLWLLWLAWLSSKINTRTTIVGFSYNNSPTQASIEMFKALPQNVRVLCRDQTSLERFRKFTGVNAEQSADVAFLLDPDLKPSEEGAHVDWIRQKSKKQMVVGINISGHSFVKQLDTPGGRSLVINTYVREIRRIIDEKNINILLIPHDLRGENSDLSLLTEILQHLVKDKDYASRVMMIEAKYITASNIKRIARSLDGVVSGRMHLAIASLGSGTPVASTVYQDKFDGLYRLFPKLKKYLISPEDALIEGKIFDTVSSLISERFILRYHIFFKMFRVRKLSKKNL